jgi:hypothetical protein
VGLVCSFRNLAALALVLNAVEESRDIIR